MKRVVHKTLQDWFEWRMGGVGSSEAPAVMRASPWTTREELWALKTERMLPKPSHPRMRRGRQLEPVARMEYERMTGLKMRADCAQHAEHDFVRATLDGLNEEAGRVLEIKCPGREDHLTARLGKIPDKYLWQCVHLLMTTGFGHLDYFSYDGERGVIVEFKRDKRLEDRLFKEVTLFWEHVLKDLEPAQKPMQYVDAYNIFKLRRRNG
jgi:putative phage-type endonuclease